jgi:hypothetical protein
MFGMETPLEKKGHIMSKFIFVIHTYQAEEELSL